MKVIGNEIQSISDLGDIDEVYTAVEMGFSNDFAKEICLIGKKAVDIDSKYNFIVLYTNKVTNNSLANVMQTIRSFIKDKKIESELPKRIEVAKDLILNALDELESKKLESDDTVTNERKKQVDKTLLDAFEMKASDIHIYCSDKGSKISFRINGDLETYGTERSQAELHSLVSVMYSSLAAEDGDIQGADFDEKKKLDGVLYRNINGKRLGARIASHSTNKRAKSFKMVIRVLGDQNEIAERMEFDQLGFVFNQPKVIDDSTRGKGVLLLIGETNSGKSASLANILMSINENEGGKKSIVSLENPIERIIKGVVQISIVERGSNNGEGIEKTMKEANSFIMRADPDVLSVAEIRDKITGDTCISMAISGHNVVSTMHTDSPFDVIERMIGLGANETILETSDCVKAVIAQKLLPKLCPKCSYTAFTIPKHSSLSILAIEQLTSMGLGHKVKQIRFRNESAKNCTCRRGVIGRELIAEVVPYSPEIMNYLITNKKELAKKSWLENIAFSKEEIAISKIFRGLIDPVDALKELSQLHGTYEFRNKHNINLPKEIYER